MYFINMKLCEGILNGLANLSCQIIKSYTSQNIRANFFQWIIQAQDLGVGWKVESQCQSASQQVSTSEFRNGKQANCFQRGTIGKLCSE